MALRCDEVEVVSGDPFQKCKLNREPYGKLLAELIKNNSEGFVLALNSEWGGGKTTFVRMWRQFLGNSPYGFRTLHFNAWENDLDDSIFVALLSELKQLKGDGSDERFDSVLKKSAPIIKSVVPSIGKALASHFIGKETVTAIAEGIGDGLAEVLDSELEAYQEKKKSLTAFRDSLEAYVKQGAESTKPVVFIIDELDRCRPDYAVSLLEHIKHLFSVPGIVFVLSIDKSQLAHAVRGVYGSDRINGEEYLRRFIDIEVTLPEPNLDDLTGFLFEYFGFDKLIPAESGKLPGPKLTVTEAKVYATDLFRFARLNLRQQEKLLAHYFTALNSLPPNQLFLSNLVLTAIYIREYHSDKYNELTEGEIGVSRFRIVLKEALPNGFEDPQGGNTNYAVVMALGCEIYNRSIENHPAFAGRLAQFDREVNDYIYNVSSDFGSIDNSNMFKYALQSVQGPKAPMIDYQEFLGCVELTSQA